MTRIRCPQAWKVGSHLTIAGRQVELDIARVAALARLLAANLDHDTDEDTETNSVQEVHHRGGD